MTRYGMLIDSTRCVSCFACRLSCQTINSLEIDKAFIHFVEKEEGVYPNVKVQTLPIQCQHCEDAPCVKNCPTGASFQRKDGIVLVDEEKCIGCKYCITACPYDARVELKKDKLVQKCNFCYQELEKGNQPACVQTCIPEARIFGDLDDPNSEINIEIKKRNAKPILSQYQTKPKIYYVNEIKVQEQTEKDIAGLTSLRSDLIKPAAGMVMGAAVAGLAANYVVATAVKNKEEKEKRGEENHE